MKHFILVILFVLAISDLEFAQDTTKQVQYRRGIELQSGYQSYEEKYFGKNILEEKRSKFPLQSTGVWTELNPKVPRVDYLGIHFVNKDTGWACGDLGALIKTTNGGIDWTVSQTNTTTPLLKVKSFNGQIVLASGYDGLILRSVDCGESFTQITSGVTGDLWGLEIVNDTLGWACGNSNSLTKTTDGGITWQRVVTPDYSSDYWWIDFLNESYGFIAANGKVLRTIDGGNSWEIIQAGDSYPLFCVDAIDSLHIAAAGYGDGVYRAKNIYSNDGGYTWINGGNLTWDVVNCIQYVNPDTGYLIMNEVGLYKTTNHGQDWTPLDLTGSGIPGLFEMQFLKNMNLGYAAGIGLRIYQASNILDVWNKLIINDNFVDVYFTNETTGFAAANRIIYKTTNAGLNWFVLPNFPSNVFTASLNSLTFTNDDTGFAGGYPTRIVKTTDAGDSWYVVNRTGLADTIGTINKIFFINSAAGWAVTSRGGILKTTDGGDNWFAQLNAGVSVIFGGVHFVDSLYGWSANSDRPFRTTDGGTNWIQQTNLNIWQSRDVFFKDYQNGFLLESNKLYKTIDGGFTWIQNQNLTGFSIARLCTYEDSTIFIIGYKTYRTIDGGESWFEFAELNGIRIKGLSLLNSGFGFGVGELGLILEYFDATYIPVELISFQGEAINNKVILNWQTASEINNKGFEIERKEPENQIWENIIFVQGIGTTTEERRYSYTDKIDKTGIYYYRLKQVDYDGSYEYSKTIEVNISSPLQYSLSQNYPNPFNSSTSIKYQIPRDEFVTIKIYDVLGNAIKTLVEENKKTGYYTIAYLVDNLGSGIYFYKLTAGDYNTTRKFILLK